MKKIKYIEEMRLMAEKLKYNFTEEELERMADQYQRAIE